MKDGSVVAGVVAALVMTALAADSAGCVGGHRAREPHPVADAIALAAGKALDQLPAERMPMPAIQVDPPMITFGVVGLRTHETRTMVIRNVSAKPVGISKLSVANKAFRVDTVQLPVTIDVGAEFAVRLRFEPSELRRYLGTLVITMTSAETLQVPLEGRAR